MFHHIKGLIWLDDLGCMDYYYRVFASLWSSTEERNSCRFGTTKDDNFNFWVKYSFILLLVMWFSSAHRVDLAASIRQLWSRFYRLSSQEGNSASVGSQNGAQPLHICVVLPPSAFGSAVKRSGRDETLLGCSFQASLPSLVFSFISHFSSPHCCLSVLCSWFLIRAFCLLIFPECLYSVHMSVFLLFDLSECEKTACRFLNSHGVLTRRY